MERVNRRRNRAGLKEQLIHCVTIAVIVIAAVVLCMLLWSLLSGSHSRVKHNESAETVSITATPAKDESEEGEASSGSAYTDDAAIVAPTAEDGTGEAGTMRVIDGRTTSSGLSGWQNSEDGKWYEVSRNICYYGGWKTIGNDTYYFDSDGYIVTGWKAISYQNGCYFDADGKYVKDKDKSKMICLTIDNGLTEYTESVLDSLAGNNAKATFFIQGSTIAQYGSILPRMTALGHTIGNFSYSGTDLGGATAETIEEEFSKTETLIKQYNNGIGSTVIRFPEGYYTREGVVLTGKANVYWDVETYDLQTDDYYQIVANVFAQLQGGCIIRMHIQTEADIQALNTFVPELVAQGYEFVSFEDMCASRGYEIIAGATYLGFKDSDLAAGMVNDL